MGFLIGLLLFVGLVVFGCIADTKADKKEKEENESAAKKWLQEQLEQPPFKVVVTTKAGKIYESEFFKPKYEIVMWFRWDYFSYTSKQLAQDKIENSFKNARYFHENTETYIPMCDVEHIKPVQAG